MKEFSTKRHNTIFRSFEDGKLMIMDARCECKKIMQVRKQVENALSCNKVMHKEMKGKSTQTPLPQYFKNQ